MSDVWDLLVQMDTTIFTKLTFERTWNSNEVIQQYEVRTQIAIEVMVSSQQTSKKIDLYVKTWRKTSYQH